MVRLAGEDLTVASALGIEASERGLVGRILVLVTDVEWRHAGEQLHHLRRRAGMSIQETSSRAGVDPVWWAALEDGVGTADVDYHQWLELVKATQPPRPEWWDEGYEHDLQLGEDGVVSVRDEEECRYWERIASVRAEIRRHYELGRSDTAAG